jgi:hypothetical protein
MEMVLTLLLAIFILISAQKILIKAGLNPWWAFSLLIPVVNVLMIWVFAFSHWSNVPKKPPEI